MTLDILPETAYLFMLIFARLGTMIMVLPALGERSVPARVRLAFALALTVVLHPVLAPAFADLPQGLYALLRPLIVEVATGLFVGLSVRLVMSALYVAGTAIAMQTGLGFAQNVDPTQGVQAALFASFLSVLAVTMILVTDLHHMLIAAIVDSYELFRPGALVPVGDFAEMAVRTVAGSFKVAVQMSAPFLVFGLIFYLGLGVLSRLMPQVQIFFVAMPVNILVGFILFMMLLGVMINWFLRHFEAVVAQFLA
ncbi:flagellar biosynthetic protein FliR [Devosia sp.]|uniref:flagellar biosynthetic protein FliR n=1 Tax=Devosia sp. TaxID=1871048 RepID=UPI0027355F5D|nr:flagellar biosynthetic protein FliR [Devosia sp.]MDP2781451.1 flagellar biosynthetic protein FliR [Devosia sp.]